MRARAASGNTVAYQPQISATNFVNKGLFEMVYSYPYPYRTFYTLNYTNYGEMLGLIGWEFDYKQNQGSARMAANFYNDNYNPQHRGGTYQGI